MAFDSPDLAFVVDGTESSFSFPEEARLGLDDPLDVETIGDLLPPEDHIWYPSYTYEDALAFQPDPAHKNLIGYVVLFHGCPADVYRSFLASELAERFYSVAQ